MISHFGISQSDWYFDFGLQNKIGLTSSEPGHFARLLHHEFTDFSYKQASIVPSKIGNFNYILKIGHYLGRENTSIYLSAQSDIANYKSEINFFDYQNDLYFSNSDYIKGAIFYTKLGFGISFSPNSNLLNEFKLIAEMNIILPADFKGEISSSKVQIAPNKQLQFSTNVQGKSSGFAFHFGISKDLIFKNTYLFTPSLTFVVGPKILMSTSSVINIIEDNQSKKFEFTSFSRGSGILFSISRKIHFGK
jgi:hypothetical protein